MYLHDKDRVLTGYICKLLMHVFVGCVHFEKEEENTAAKKLAVEVQMSFLRDVADERKRRNLYQRVLSLEKKTIYTLGDKVHGSKVMLVIYYLLSRLLELGVAVIPEDSKEGKMLNHCLESLGEALEEDKLLRSAEKQAERWFRVLQDEGYLSTTLCFSELKESA